MCDEHCDSVIITHNQLLPKQACFCSGMIALWLRYTTRCQCWVLMWHVSRLKTSRDPSVPLHVDFDFDSTDDMGMKSTLTRALCVWNTKENTCEGFCECWAMRLTTEPCAAQLQCRLTDSTGFRLSDDDSKLSHFLLFGMWQTVKLKSVTVQ